MCRICNKLKAYLIELDARGHFRFSPGSRTVDDLYTKYMTGNPEYRNFKVYIDDLKLCPECKSSEVGSADSIDFARKSGTKDKIFHIHSCASCGWKSEEENGIAFHTFETPKNMKEELALEAAQVENDADMQDDED